MLDLGKQPISNRFLKKANEKEYKYPMIVGQCHACGLIQLTTPFPSEELKPRYSWITYNEPEAHLNKLANAISKLPGISKNSVISGISFKDDSLLERLKNLGFNNTWRISAEDFGAGKGNIGVETIQGKLDSSRAEKILQNHSKPDVIIARHIIEHAYDITKFFNALKYLVKPDGFIILEVPDCAKAFELGDATILWEEHISYFTQATFQNLFKLNGCPFSYYESFPYPLENSLVGIAKIKGNASYPSHIEALDIEVERAAEFVDKVNKKRKSIKKFFSEYSKNVGKISLFGAGHLTCLYVNFFDLKDYVEFIVDDNPNKKGLYMPGSGLQIRGSEHLIKEDIRLCLLGVNPNIEEKVISNNKAFVGQGGIFLSIFQGSRHSLQLDDNPPNIKTSNLIPYSEEVLISSNKIIKIGKEELETLKKKAILNTRKRARICAHRNPNDPVHEMIIALAKGTYIRPHKHLNKPESFHLISGFVDAVIFDDDGSITEVMPLGDFQSGRAFYYRMDKPYYHTLLIKSDVIVFHEATKGPFRREDAEFAEWAPKEEDSLAAEKFMRKIEEAIERRGLAKKRSK